MLHALLLDAYRTFSVSFSIKHDLFSEFFNGPIRDLLNAKGIQICRRHLSLFFKYYLPTIPFNQLRFFADIYGNLKVNNHFPNKSTLHLQTTPSL